jgi:hypothetical protein
VVDFVNAADLDNRKGAYTSISGQSESRFIDDTKHIEEQIFLIVECAVYFAIDDFGTGYSNFNYLSKFNTSTLKIDMSFVRDMMGNMQLHHIVNAIIKISDAMDLESVAQGVEAAETAEILKTAFIDKGILGRNRSLRQNLLNWRKHKFRLNELAPN